MRPRPLPLPPPLARDGDVGDDWKCARNRADWLPPEREPTPVPVREGENGASGSVIRERGEKWSNMDDWGMVARNTWRRSSSKYGKK